MKNLLSILLISLLTGCATIISGSTTELNVTSSPSAAKFSIADEDGKIVYTGKTPETVTLENGAGYFDGATYHLVFEKTGYYDESTLLDSQINGWYFGNYFLGGIVGGLIIDPYTGGMWKLPTQSSVILDRKK